MSKRLLRDGIWTALAVALPAVAAVLSVPVLISNLGDERAGIVLFFQAILGSSALLDLGVGRALTRGVSLELGSAPHASWSRSAVAGIRISVLIAGLMVLLVLVASIASSGFAGLQLTKDVDREERLLLSSLIALGIAVGILGNAFRGVSEAMREFRIAAAIKMSVGLLSFALPAILSTYSQSLSLAGAALVLARIWNALAFALLSSPIWKEGWLSRLNRKDYKELLTFSGWLMISALSGLAFSLFDRLILAARFPPAEMAYYSAPLDLLTKLSVVTAVFSTILLPRLSAVSDAKSSQSKTLFRYGALGSCLVVIPFCFLFFIFSDRLLSAWLGAEFASLALPIAEVLLLGAAANALAVVPHTYLIAFGHVKALALFHLLQIPLFVLAIWFLSERFGVMGVAWAWTIRMILDAIPQIIACLIISSSAPRSRKLIVTETQKLVPPISDGENK